MIGCDTDVGRVFTDHLQYGIEDTDNGAEPAILTLGKSTQAEEMPEKFVRFVDKMNDHFGTISYAALFWLRAAI